MNIPKLLQQAGAYLNDGDPNSADMVLHRILKKQPKHVDALNLSGVAAYHRKDFKRAGYLLKKVISQDPHRASAHLNLGAVFNSSNAFGEAEQHYFTTLRLEPENAVAMCNLGKNFLDQNKYSEARKWLESSVINDSQYWVASHNLATCLQRMGETDRAIETYRRTLNIFDNPLSLSELIVSLRRTDRFAEEYLLAKRLLGMPDAADLAISAWETLFDACDWDAIESSIEKIIRQLEGPDARAECRSRGLLLLNSLVDVAPKRTFDCHRAWAKSLPALPSPGGTFSVRESTSTTLRIGYISGDFREHSVGYFCRNLIANHDRQRFEVYCYANSIVSDNVSRQIASAANKYLDVTQLSDLEFRTVIKNDAVDILVDLSGHTRDSRLAVMNRRLAPVQISYLGYPNTTGLDEIDFRISDPHVDIPTGTQYSETLLRMPESFLCFGEFDDVARRASTPGTDNGHITFGCFNSLRKINPQVIRAWSSILNRVPNSRLIIKSKRAADPITQKNLLAMFGRYNIDLMRIHLRAPTETRLDHLDAYNEIDIALDTFPYHGTTTTCEALWMGAPVVTFTGNVHAQRVSYSILKNLSLDTLITYSIDEYVERNIALAGNLAELNELRQQVPRRLRESILCDARRFTKQFEQTVATAFNANSSRPRQVSFGSS
ncbi:MAG: protein O-GlcNAc transferase [Gammaproteobacteria bacterium]|jgi:protein O-GlcNAc transferase